MNTEQERCTTPQIRPHQRRLWWSVAAVSAISGMAGLLAACGGGGGSTASSDPQTESPGSVQTGGLSTGPALDRGPDSFLLAPDASMADGQALSTLGGGQFMFTAWNPNEGRAMAPGLKVMFFGQAEGCAAGIQGPVASVDDARLGEVAALTGVSAAASPATLRWTPSGASSGCDAATQDKRGASLVYVNAADGQGGVGMLTSSGPQADGSTSFFRTYPSGGQNGQGDNADLTGTFVNVRFAPWAGAPLQPWASGGKARLRSVQSLGTLNVPSRRSSDGVVQAKQQMMATFFNLQCTQELPGKACQIQYLMDTGIARAGVSNWSAQNWFKDGDVWFDPVQGGIPIVSGPVHASGLTTVDETSRMELWSSQGSESQHTSFERREFDVTISLPQLMNVIRITTGRKAGIAPTDVTDEQMATLWGSHWNDPSAWSVLSVDMGQEVHNPSSSRAEVGGGFHSLYVGPQP